MQRFFACVEMFNKRLQSFLEVEQLFFIISVVLKGDFNACVEISDFANPFAKRFVIELYIAEYLFVRQKFNRRSLFVCRPDFLNRPFGISPFALKMAVFAVAINVRFEPFTQRINNADADAVQPAGDFIRIVVELAACVKSCQDNLKSAFAGFFMYIDRYSAAVVLDRAASVNMNVNTYRVASASHCLVDGVV